MSDREHPQWLADDLARSQPERDAWNARLRAEAEREAEADRERERNREGMLLEEADNYAMERGSFLEGKDYLAMCEVFRKVDFVTYCDEPQEIEYPEVDAFLDAIGKLPEETRKRLAGLIRAGKSP